MKARLAAALLVLAAAPGCDPQEDRERLLDTIRRLEAVCLGPFNVAQTPGGLDPQGHPRQSNYLFSATLHNPGDRPVGAGLRFSMTVTGGGRTVSSPPPYVELPPGALIRAGTAARPAVHTTPVLVTIPAVAGARYTIQTRLWNAFGAETDDGSPCHRRTDSFQ
ncbi:MAG TPA: hypothetical protein VF718_04135 [Allosphingosinicella sp.]|jgi:hypothetical protein